MTVLPGMDEVGVAALDRRPPRLGHLRRRRRRRGADRRDAAAALAAGGGEVVDGEGRADRPADHEADRADHQARGRHADARRRRLRRRRGAVRAARVHARAADRSRQDVGPRRADPGAGRHQGGAALVHLLPPVRLSDRPRRRQPRPARRRSALLPRVVRGPAALRPAGREDVPPHPGEEGAVLRPRDGRRRPACASWRRRCTTASIPDRVLLPRPPVRGRARQRRLPRLGRPAVHRRSSRSASRATRDELVIDLGTWRRTLVLPRILVDAPTEGARFEDGTLKIRFGTPAR